VRLRLEQQPLIANLSGRFLRRGKGHKRSTARDIAFSRIRGSGTNRLIGREIELLSSANVDERSME